MFFRGIWIYLAAVNLVTFVLFFIDKRKAVRGKWRIRESVLLWFSFAGGTFGGLAAMKLFRHKTQTRLFAVGLPLMFLLHLVVFGYLLAVTA